MLNEIKTTKVLDITSAALIKGIRGKKLSPAQKKQAKQYREELFEEYAAGEMSPEKKALILDILGPNFFAPVDKFEAQCKEVEAYLARKAQEKVDKRKAQFEHHLQNAAAYHASLAQKKAQRRAASAKKVTA
jgi:hypothetical protein